MSRSSAKHWCFTLNNPTDVESSLLRSVVSSGLAGYIVFGLEVSLSGTVHYQGHLYRPEKARLGWLKKNISLRAHWTISKDPLLSIAYCRKGTQSHTQWDEFGVDGADYGSGAVVEEFGETPPLNGSRSDLSTATSLVQQRVPMRDVALRCGDAYVRFHRGLHALQSIIVNPYQSVSVRGVWIVGPPGVGKSHVVRNSEPSLFIKSQNKWWDGYAGEHAVLIDDFDKSGKCLGHHIKIWADKWRCTGEVKGATIGLEHHRLYITSNYTIEEIWGGDDDDQLLVAINRRFAVISKTSRDDDISDQLFAAVNDLL